MIIKGYVFSIVYAMLCILGASLLGKVGVPKKYTRKFVHILVGFEWVILYRYMGAGSHHFLAVCLLFTLLLAVEYKCKLFPAMSSEGDNAPGTVYYAIAMSIMATVTVFLPDMILPFGVAVFCTSFGDGFAAVVGQSIVKYNPRIWGSKTLFGSLCGLFVCLAVPLVFRSVYDSFPLSVWQCVFVALLAFEIELFMGYGLDNIAITLATASFTYALAYVPGTSDYIVPILATPLIIALAYRKKSLTLGGVIAAIALDLLVSVSLANFGFTVLLTFFIGSIAVDKVKKHYKKTRSKIEIDREKRGDCRDVVQVLANGFVPGVMAFLYLITSEHVFVLAFIASLAEAFADTAASGIGFFSSRVFDPFRFERCDSGISGGMSLLGTFASLCAAATISAVALSFGRITITEMLIVTGAAFLGAIFDSFLGSLFQIKYKCRVCAQVIEKTEHCGARAEKYRGFAPVSNDVVNLLSTLFSAVIAVAFVIL